MEKNTHVITSKNAGWEIHALANILETRFNDDSLRKIVETKGSKTLGQAMAEAIGVKPCETVDPNRLAKHVFLSVVYRDDSTNEAWIASTGASHDEYLTYRERTETLYPGLTAFYRQHEEIFSHIDDAKRRSRAVRGSINAEVHAVADGVIASLAEFMRPLASDFGGVTVATKPAYDGLSGRTLGDEVILTYPRDSGTSTDATHVAIVDLIEKAQAHLREIVGHDIELKTQYRKWSNELRNVPTDELLAEIARREAAEKTA